MTPEQAIAVVTNATAKVVADRNTHIQISDAIRALTILVTEAKQKEVEAVFVETPETKAKKK